MKYLALDVGRKRTGVAYLDDAVGIPLPLDTIRHDSEEEFLSHVLQLVSQRTIDTVVIGLPRLPSGEEGSQAIFVREWGDLLLDHGVDVRFVDERYTSLHRETKATSRQEMKGVIDKDSLAACEILRSFVNH